jgi:DNA-binding transcriptional MerR regulator
MHDQTASIPAMDRSRRYSVAELAATVGMSPRNIRAYQSRRLLPPPCRQGRLVYYDEQHVRRLRAVRTLQRQGFNLTAIAAMLGVGADVPSDANLLDALNRVGRDKPTLMYALARHGLVNRADAGGVQPLRPRTLQAALALTSSGASAGTAMVLLAELMDRLRPVADDLMRSASARLVGPGVATGGQSWADLDSAAVGLAHALVELLTEAFRAVLDNKAEDIVGELIARQLEPTRLVSVNRRIDNG